MGRNTLLEWLFKIGLPLALFALGVGMTGYSNFWLGISLAFFAVCFFAVDWWLISRHHALGQRLCGFGIVCFLFSIIGFMAFRPAPLLFEVVDKPGDYIPGSKAYGITWDDMYSEGRVIMTNPTAYDYSNIDFKITSDLSIAAISITGDFSSCVWGVDGMPDFSVHLVGKGTLKPEPVPNIQPIAPNRRVRCDKLPSHSEMTIELALLSLNPVLNGRWPKQLTSSRHDPKWISFRGFYEAFGRSRPFFEAKCFAPACEDMPTLVTK
jgi:hypothetical protein